ncbi:hypothetical protein Rt10032_c19g6256 [Rhodotorula toruloides]|uniref:Uncharacterized protein n=1 Tax=Rhodotorula toruloides TaxID=5286 RepID=A0A511KPE1_RHOTO|nr:hypothetical protein Rt10032_c19g6256 [Rhodotorula toruloides]
MPAFSGLQMLLYGAGCVYSGYRLSTSPSAFLAQLSPATRLIEEQTGLKAHTGGDTSGRLALALLSFWVCKNTPHGTSLVALFGGVNLVAGLLMGLSVGFGDGNAVDLELKARAMARRREEEAKKAR